MAHILAIGIATLDIINTVEGYPGEDDEVRALSQRIGGGGNATNTLVVLSQLGHHCSWGGVLVEETDVQYILADLDDHRIDRTPCRILQQGKMPTSYIVLNQRNGSRSIVHYRDLPEFSLEDFQGIDLGNVDWLHFEGRNPVETLRMLQYAQEVRPDLTCSVEVEKSREGIETLFAYADVLLFSPGYAAVRGQEPEALLDQIHRQHPQIDMFCTKGAAGALALDRQGRWYRSRAFTASRVVDTLGAGDTFNAAVIDGYLRGFDIGEVLRRSCRIAGIKVGQMGLNGLALGAVI